MKIRKIIFSLFSTVVGLGVAHASMAPAYIGGQGGYSNTNFSKGSFVGLPGYVPINTATISNHLLMFRAYAGYQFNDYLAAEAGYSRWRSTRVSNINSGAIPNGSVSEYGWDLTGKLFLPMAAYIHLYPYLKVGVTYINAQSHNGITRNGPSDFGYSWHPLYGLGIGYGFYKAMVVDFSYTIIPQHNTPLPRINIFALGLTYFFNFLDESTHGNVGSIDENDP